MKLNILVVTTQRWDSRAQKHATIKKLMQSNGDLQVSIHTKLYTGGKPHIIDKDGTNRIDPVWFEQNISRDAKVKGYNQVIFHFSMEEGTRWKVDSGLRGSSFNDGDYFGEGWVKANETTLSKFHNGTERNRYEKTLPHEIGHCLYHHKLTPLLIHDFDFQARINNIEGFYGQLKIRNEQHATVSLLASLKKLLDTLLATQKEKPQPFFIKDYPITQHFGAKSSLYKTGVHIGTDYACPVGTSILAPLSGTITETGSLPEVGNYLLFTTVKGTYRLCHLHSIAEKGVYEQGETIAFSGNTGKSTGPHLHAELWKKKVDLWTLSKANYKEYLLDITKVV